MSKTLIKTILFGFCFLFVAKSHATNLIADSLQISVSDSVIVITSDTLVSKKLEKNSAFISVDGKENQRKKKIISALMAFPFPFGFMGAHRVMLGCKPWVPVVYVATFGGCFGLLPLIDFCVIVFTKDITQYENNSNIFMWIK